MNKSRIINTKIFEMAINKADYNVIVDPVPQHDNQRIKAAMDAEKDSENLTGKNTDTSEVILPNSRLQSLEAHVKIPENTLNLDTKEKESESEVRTQEELSDPVREAPQKYLNLRSCNRGKLLSYDTQGLGSLTINLKTDIHAEKGFEILNKTDNIDIPISVLKLRSLEDHMANVKMVENTLNSEANEKEIEKEIKSEMKLPRFAREVQEGLNLQSCDGRNFPNYGAHGQSSLTIHQPSGTSNVYHPVGILSPTMQNKDNSDIYQENLGSFSSDVLSAFQDSMTSLQMNFSNEIFNKMFKQIKQNDPHLLGMFKIKFIVDNQIREKLLKYYEVMKSEKESLSGPALDQDEDTLQLLLDFYYSSKS